MTRDEVVQTIRQVAREEGFADVDLLLATGWQESGFRPDAVGDQGHSVGTFQENDRGRGAGLSAAQRSDVAAATRRAIWEFAAVRQRFPNVSRGEWAARAQRPADQPGYAASINRMLGGQDRAFSQAVTATGTSPGVRTPAQRGAGTNEAVGGPIADADAPQWLKDAWAAGSTVGRTSARTAAPAAAAGGSDQGELWPVAGQPWGRVNNPFGAAQSRAAGTTVALPSSNVGADLTAAYGAPILAPVSGQVVQVYDAPNEQDRNLNGGWGGMVLFRGDNGYFYRFSHQKPGSLRVQPGQRVQQGQQLGQVGVSGNTTGPHLDAEKFDRPGHFVDIAGGAGRSAQAPLTSTASTRAPIAEAEAPDWLKQAWDAGSRVGRDVGAAAQTLGDTVGATVGAAGTAAETVTRVAEDVAPDWLKDAWAAGSRVGR